MSRRTSLATRKQRRHLEELRKSIQIGQLIDRLIAHVCSPKPLMDESQVQSALVLLNKMLPDLSVMQLTSDADSPLANTAVEWRVVNAIPDKSDDDSSDTYTACIASQPIDIAVVRVSNNGKWEAYGKCIASRARIPLAAQAGSIQESDRELGELVMPVSQLMLVRTVSQTGERMGSGTIPREVADHGKSRPGRGGDQDCL